MGNSLKVIPETHIYLIAATRLSFSIPNSKLFSCVKLKHITKSDGNSKSHPFLTFSFGMTSSRFSQNAAVGGLKPSYT